MDTLETYHPLVPDEGDIPRNKSASQCLDEFDNLMVKQEDFNA